MAIVAKTSPKPNKLRRLFVAVELPPFVRRHCRDTIARRLLPLDDQKPTSNENESGSSSVPSNPKNNDQDATSTPSSVKWILDESLFHCTLRFLGPVDERAIPDLSRALAEGCRRVPPFALRAGGLGCFPHSGSTRNARVVWMGLCSDVATATTTTTPLADLARRVADVTEPLGFPRDERPFRAHVTLGRTRTMREPTTATTTGARRRRRRRGRTASLSPPLREFLEETMARERSEASELRPFQVKRVALMESVLLKQGPSYTTLERFDLLGSADQPERLGKTDDDPS